MDPHFGQSNRLSGLLLKLGFATLVMSIFLAADIAVAQSTPVTDSCKNGIAVGNQQDNPLLVQDCNILLTALDTLADLDLNTILVPAVERGVNEHELGPLVRFALEHPAVRGLNIQPVTHTGRHLPFDPLDRVTIPEVIQRIEDQTDGTFLKSDFVPVPCCHPGCQSVTYAYVDDDGQVTPLPRILNVDDYLDYITNRSWPDPSAEIRHALESLWSSSAAPGTDTMADHFSCASCDIDLAASGSELAKRIFAISIKDFMDAYTFDVKKLMKCCVEIIAPDGRMIPFCAYNNVGYREEVRDAMKLERARQRLAGR